MPVIPIEDVLFYDAETRSRINLKKSGAWRYMEDSSTDVYVVCWAIGEDPVQAWFPGQPVPQAILDHAAAGKYFSAHNVGFEYPLTNWLLAPRYGWPKLTISQMHDTAAEAAAMGLPRALEEVGQALGLKVRKDKEGHALMMRMARPRRIEYEKCGDCEGTGRYRDDTCWFCEDGFLKTPVWWEDQERIDRLTRYCAIDVEVAREVFKRVRRLPDDERRVWELDQAINERGVKVDIGLARALEDTVESCKMDLDDRMWRITGSVVPKCSNAAALVRWLQNNGIETDSCAKPVVTSLLMDRRVSKDVKTALELRRTAGKSSTAKLAVMQYAACADNRLRGMFRYHGAQTGRWAGSLVQLHNLVRKSPPGPLTLAVETVLNYGYDGIKLLYGDPMGFSSSMLRPCLIAGKDEEMYTADLAQIEARMIAALAGEQDVLDVFERGEDVYCHAATGIFGREITKRNDQERQVGKVSTLALGFQGGPVAFSAMAKNYNLDIASAHDTVLAVADPYQVERARLGWKSYHGDMSEKAYLTADLIKQAWRLANPAIVQFWYDLESAALKAVLTRRPVRVGALVFQAVPLAGQDYLWMRLPNGRLICYTRPEVRTVTTPWKTSKDTVFAWTTHSRTKKWTERTLYGGLLAENATQAASRDVLVEAVLRLDAAGYDIVGHVHDEVILTTKRGTGSADEIRDLMTRRSPWMVDLNLPVGVDVSPPLTRYQK
jgi:DNA polymerase